MKPNFFNSLLIFFISCFGNAYSQTTITGQLRDARSLAPIANVLVTSIPDSNSTISNALGQFELKVQDSITVDHIGYLNLKLPIDASDLLINLEPSDFLLSEAVVLANHQEQNLLSTTSAVTRIDKKEIKLAHHLDFSTVLNQAPGVFMHAGTFNTNRITVRGIGSRNLFGTAKIRAYFGNIPLTNGSGESTIENLSLTDFESIEVIRGPSGNQYGAGLGGTILLNPLEIEEGLTMVKIRGGFGSYNATNWGVSFKKGGAKNKTYFSISRNTDAGYRQNNDFRRANINLFSQQKIAKDATLDLIYAQTDLTAQIPSSINLSDYNDDPTQAAFTWHRSNGQEESTQHLAGINWDQSFSSFDQSVAVFYNRTDEYEIRPFNIIDNTNNTFGGRAKWNNYSKNNRLKWLVGFEAIRDRRSWETFKTVVEEEFTTGGTTAGNNLNNYLEEKLVFNTFLQSSYNFNPTLSITAGININKTEYILDDLVNQDSLNQSAEISFPNIASPKFDLSYQPDAAKQFSIVVSHGFSAPTLEETLLPDGLINFDIRPEEGWNYELGWKQIFKKKLNFELNLYLMQVKNLLVARRNSFDQYIGINAGKSRSVGLENQMTFKIFNGQKIKVEGFTLLNLQRFKFVDFEDDGNRYDGNFLPGLPRNRWQIGLDVRLPLQFECSIRHSRVGAMFLRDDNILEQPAYNLMNITLQQKIPFGKWQAAWSLRINNILNEKYASMLLINANSFDGNLPRYFYPGRPRHIFGQVSLTRFFQ